MRSLIYVLLLVFSSITQARLSSQERGEVMRRVHAFYSQPTDPVAMSQRIPKYDVEQRRWALPRQTLASRAISSNALVRLAGAKADDRFQREYCAVLAKHFPKVDCDKPWAAIEANDKVEDLVETWIEKPKLVEVLDEVPPKGETKRDLWSDDYWRMRWGLTSYRYAEYDKAHPPTTYRETVALYAQPTAWKSVVGLPEVERVKQIVRWSPAEKYDLSVGDIDFTLTNEQKEEGKTHLVGGDVESWMGICHGWAAASVMDAKPIVPVKVAGPGGATVEWYPNDIRAMGTLAWANGKFDSNFIGGRCNVKDVKTYPNGRIRQQDCFDTNPATFHLALANLVGKERQSFIIDSSFDYEIWNQPIKNYDFTYFSPLDPDEQSEDWKEVAVDYDAAFKAIDRFQHPRTRGVRGETGYDDTGIKKIVGVIAAVEYLSENTPPPYGAAPQAEVTRRVTYTYDLELHEVGGRFVPKGGEWHDNSHPDFMWLPHKGSFAAAKADKEAFTFTGKIPPDDKLAALAEGASASGIPLCRVVKELFRQSSGKDDYLCPP